MFLLFMTLRGSNWTILPRTVKIMRYIQSQLGGSMSVTIDFPPETETILSKKAAERGVSLAQYLRQLVEDTLPRLARPELSPAERAALWHQISHIPTGAPPLSDEAISRESMYDTRG
jgi:hypothetical protein